MPVEKWSDTVIVAHLADDPQFSEDCLSIEEALINTSKDAVLDLAAVHFLNSSNLSRLLKLRKQLHSRDRKLLLCSMSEQVWSAFVATGLDRVFDFSQTVPTALATLQMAGS
jgi:anti-anti-sigma factor